MALPVSLKPANTCSYPQCTSQSNTLKKCSSCRRAMYCGAVCQKGDWKRHKVSCQAVEKMNSLTLSYRIEEFSDRDLKVLGLSKEKVKELNEYYKSKGIINALSKRNLSCFDFALLEIGEIGCKEQIFLSIDPKVSYQSLMETRLNKWRYEKVNSPKAQDLVLYSDEKDLNHMGVYQASGLILSKCGNENHFATLCSLEALSVRYGSKVIFYRKMS